MGRFSDILAENEASRARLAALLAGLSDDDLARPLDGAWTVAAALAHLAFYDWRIAALLERDPGAGPVRLSPLDAEIINAASLPLYLAVPPRRAAALALQAAEAADRAVAALSPEAAQRFMTPGSSVNLQRAEHRLEHVEELEALFGQRPPAPGAG
jgi:hypothetical protein